MNKDLEIFAKRLRQARVKAKLSLEGLSQKMDVDISKQAISKYEKGVMMPSSTILISLSKALNMDLEYFFRPFTFDLDDFKVSFRKRANTTVSDEKALAVQIQDEVERYIEVEDILNVNSGGLLSEGLIPKAPLSSKDDMVNCARMVRDVWKLGDAPIKNAVDLLESRGVKVLFTDAPDNFFGVSGIVNDGFPVIVLNSRTQNIEFRRLTTFHELCHLLYNMYFAENLSEKEKEQLCNSFANELLLPGRILQEQFVGKNKIAIAELVTLSRTYGISVDAIVYKLYDLGIIGGKRYSGYFKRKNADSAFKARMERSFFKEENSCRFQTMVYRALGQELISTSKAAMLLGVSINNVRQNSVTV